MNKLEWDLYNKLDRRTTYLANQIRELNEGNVKAEKLQLQMDEVVMPVVLEVQRILVFRKRIKQMLFWILSVIIGAAITTVVTERIQLYIAQDVRLQVQSVREVPMSNK